MLTIKKVLLSTILACTVFSVSADSKLASLDSVNAQQIWAESVAKQMAEIKSTEDLYKLEDSEVWNSLSEHAQRDFIESLVINNRGLASLNHSVLEAELTASEIYTLLSLFGAQKIASTMIGARVEDATDVLILSRPSLNHSEETFSVMSGGTTTKGETHRGYYCAYRGTCLEQDGSTCTSSC
ncbi:hypothetical protein [Arsukibacterium ikkense]|uniref:hypothetical protein n=1 Tax=Arsukibacterium ikkense TaxID=336831 RepID=UPI00128E36D7|nr:hypothetical protein [Arsukibacterium ikkense]